MRLTEIGRRLEVRRAHTPGRAVLLHLATHNPGALHDALMMAVQAVRTGALGGAHPRIKLRTTRRLRGSPAKVVTGWELVIDGDVVVAFAGRGESARLLPLAAELAAKDDQALTRFGAAMRALART